MKINFSTIVQKQRDFFARGHTLSYDFRLRQLKSLEQAIRAGEKEIASCLAEDLGKSYFEAYISEIGLVLDELTYTIKHLKKWMKVKRVKTPLSSQPARSRIYQVPYGQVLIISPWNYPFQLAMVPLIGAIAAGNTVVLKSSRKARHTGAWLGQVVRDLFPEEYVYAVNPEEISHEDLLGEKFDYIFFTGSVAVGKTIMGRAAENLTPVTLELGGKSPAIIDKSAHVDLSAKRIVWGKLMNAGQTCVAPDYVCVHESIKDRVLDRMLYWIKAFYGEDVLANSDYPRIIDEKAFDRLLPLLEGDRVVGGRYDRDSLKIEPTILDHVSFSDPVMQEEIFGPILPILTYRDLDDLILKINGRPSPLALYLFTQDKTVEDRVIREIQFGGGCVNDCLMHLASPYLPFGGVGESGMGRYHGRENFTTFSHGKSIQKKANFLDPSLRYPPGENKLSLIRKLLGS